MPRLRSIALALPIAVAVPVAGCTGGGDGGSPKRYGSGLHTIESECRDDVDSRNYRIDAEGGTLTLTLAWDDSDGDDLDLYLEDPDDDEGLFEGDSEIPPGDSPAQIEVVVPAMNLLATVECYDWPVPFTLALDVP